MYLKADHRGMYGVRILFVKCNVRRVRSIYFFYVLWPSCGGLRFSIASCGGLLSGRRRLT